MAQSVKCLLYKHKSVSFISQNPNKKPLQQILALGRQSQDDARICWQVCLAESGAPGPAKDSISDNKVKSK